MKKAIILVDMLNDFVTGAIKCERAERIIAPLQKLTDAARKNGVYVIYSNDAHIKGIDREFDLWGPHAVIGEKGAEIIPELAFCEGDYIVPKRRYSGFFQTDMQLLLTELCVDTVIMTGLHVNMCVRHTTADAYQYGYKIIVAGDGTDAFTQEDYESGLDYLKNIYGAQISTVDEIIKNF